MVLSYVRKKLTFLVLAILNAGLVASAMAQSTEAGRIGEVWLQSEAAVAPYHRALVEGLHELGYIEGKNLILLTRYANDDESRLPSLLDELLRLHVDVLFVSNAVVDPARKITTTIPIVCATMNDPVGAGQVASLSRPGGNVTGLSWQSVDTATKRLELALELRPKPSRLAVLFDGADWAAQREAEIVISAARAAKVTVVAYELRVPSDMQTAFTSMTRRRPQALYVVDSPTTIGMREQIAARALEIHVPLISESCVWTDAGGVLSYGAKLTPTLKRGAVYIDRILKGAKPQDLPIEQPTEFELIVNLKSAKAVGVSVPQSIMDRADNVIR